MNSEYQPRPETIQKTMYTLEDTNGKELKVNRDDVLQAAAIALEDDPTFHKDDSQMLNKLKACRAIKNELARRGMNTYVDDALSSTLTADALELLELFK